MNWEPFLVAPEGTGHLPIRPLDSLEGVGDRLRSAAFAEIQAREAFLWAAEKFEDAPPALKDAWRTLAREENKHMNWLLTRLTELGIGVRDRMVSTHLWQSFMNCTSAEAFSVYMASAEERGQKAGFRFHEFLKKSDPATAAIFRTIAEEETSHIELARRYFPDTRLGTQKQAAAPVLESTP